MDIRVERDSIIKFEGMTDDFHVLSSNVVFWKLYIDSEYVGSSFELSPQEEFDRIIKLYKLKDEQSCLNVNIVEKNLSLNQD